LANGSLQIKKHTLQKYDILRKYLKACLTFEKKYENFAYIDTHGGSGKVLFEGKEINGSPLIGAESEAHPQCYAIEINQERRMLLRKAVGGIPNIKIIEGDCNKQISSLLKQIEDRKFTFCFLDPDGLVYDDGGRKVFQLTWSTIEEISRRKNSEILVNLQTQGIIRCMGAIREQPERAGKLAEDITALIGNDTWSSKHTRFELRGLFLDRLQSIGFTHVGAVNIKSEDNSHMYYLIYGSHHEVGAKIMSSNFKFAWGLKPLTELPLQRFIYDDIPHAKETTEQTIQTKLFG
jgi:three-Cys-motif partner protein